MGVYMHGSGEHSFDFLRSAWSRLICICVGSFERLVLKRRTISITIWKKFGWKRKCEWLEHCVAECFLKAFLLQEICGSLYSVQFTVHYVNKSQLLHHFTQYRYIYTYIKFGLVVPPHKIFPLARAITLYPTQGHFHVTLLTGIIPIL